MVVNQAAAQRYWPGQDAIGQHITMNKTDYVVVGVVGNIHHLGPEIAPRQECYIPRRRTSSTAARWWCGRPAIR
jgi:hypothetical protein